MDADKAREVLAATWDKRGRLGLGCTIRRGADSEWSKSDVAIEAMLAFAATARTDALREAAEAVQAMSDGAWAEKRYTAQNALLSARDAILSLLTKEPEA